MNDPKNTPILLVVDDVPGNLQLLFRYLSRHGFRVLVADSAAKALQQIPQEPPDLILLDIMMPNMDGFEMCRILKADPRTVDIPVIFMTALTDTRSKVEGFEAGAVDYLTKPIQNAELIARVNTHLRLYRLQKQVAQQNRELQVILDNSPMGIAFLSHEQYFFRVNDKMGQLFGYAEEELRGSSLARLYPAEAEYEQFLQRAENALRSGGMYSSEQLLRHRDGRLLWCRVLEQAVDRGDPTKGLIWNVEDISERRAADEKMRLAQAVLETTTEGIMITDADNLIIDVNPAFTQITGYAREEVLSQTPTMFNSEYHDESFYQEMWENLKNNGRWRGEIWNRHKDGKVYPQYLSIAAVYGPDGKVIQHVAIFYDISQRKQYEALIEHQANYDALTDLPNRLLFMKRLAQAVGRALEDRARVALMFIDLDMFKEVNDTLGHAYGDLLLQAVAERLLACVRESDTVARLGGDEFTVILSEVHNPKHVTLIADKLLQQLSQSFELDGHEVRISGSIGITLAPDDAQDVETLLKYADSAMYKAKETGRNAYYVYAAESPSTLPDNETNS